jgi:hypothetical protein
MPEGGWECACFAVLFKSSCTTRSSLCLMALAFGSRTCSCLMQNLNYVKHYHPGRANIQSRMYIKTGFVDRDSLRRTSPQSPVDVAACASLGETLFIHFLQRMSS